MTILKDYKNWLFVLRDAYQKKNDEEQKNKKIRIKTDRKAFMLLSSEESLRVKTMPSKDQRVIVKKKAKNQIAWTGSRVAWSCYCGCNGLEFWLIWMIFSCNSSFKRQLLPS